jgi:hypothetical protein
VLISGQPRPLRASGAAATTGESFETVKRRYLNGNHNLRVVSELTSGMAHLAAISILR